MELDELRFKRMEHRARSRDVNILDEADAGVADEEQYTGMNNPLDNLVRTCIVGHLSALRLMRSQY